ncbi:MAG: hypothetical protein M3436_12965 [Pseudomonadota bacterium]|nr:hypothetical protein [Pseudomonadota bacterium]
MSHSDLACGDLGNRKGRRETSEGHDLVPIRGYKPHHERMTEVHANVNPRRIATCRALGEFIPRLPACVGNEFNDNDPTAVSMIENEFDLFGTRGLLLGRV